jgi:pyoverdine/dityrosine biosynthesis protein Dit1
MGKRQPNMQAVRRQRWERQRREAIKNEQIERCYKQYTPPQIKALQDEQKRTKGRGAS